MSRGAPGTFTRVVLSRPILFISLIVFLWLLWHIRDSPSIRDRISTTVPSRPWRPSTNHADTKPACRSLPGAADVVAVMRTGATELADKLPVHFSTTLKCFHDYLIFSDYEEYLDGEHILDALESVSPEIKATHPDFELWRRLRADGGRAGLRADELSGPDNRPHGGLGKDENPGWKLDKWKFLPMVNRTLAEFPDKKWYLFLEADTFVFARSLFAQLAALDWTKPYYVGSEMQIGDVLFAHGGSGFIVSRPALQAVVRLFVSQQEEWERFTDGHWAGDCVLGKAFLDSGTPVVWANPIWQGMPVGQVPWEKEGLLCRPAVSYHHVSPSVVEDMWRFEQQLAVNHRLNVSVDVAFRRLGFDDQLIVVLFR